MRNLILGIASLLVAVVLWLQIQPLYNPDREREIGVTLAIRNLPPGMVALQAPPTVKVLVSATAAEMENLDSGEFEAFIDAASSKAGEFDFPVQVTGPTRGGISAAPVRKAMRLTIARVGRITKPVELLTTGLPPRDLVYDGSSIVPGEVALSGPETSLSRVDRVRATLDLSRIRPRSDFTLEVEPLDQDGKPVPLVTSEPDKVVVSPAVGSAPTIKRVIVNPTFVGMLPFGYSIDRYEVRPTQVELTGSSPDLARMSSIETEPISLDNVTKTSVKEVGLVIPAGLRIKGRAVVRVTLVPKGGPVPPAEKPPGASQ